MMVPDVNLLLYAEITAFPQHAIARVWWEKLLSSGTEVGLASPVLFGFIRIVTNPRILATPMTVEKAIERVSAWLELPSVRLVAPGPKHIEIAFRLLRVLGTAANLTTDAQIAALAIENGATVCSNDSDFGRFAGLTWLNPLARRTVR
ncbi:type II toxin-antitoxin system VapC family toxin [soil metagenome]